MMKERSWDRLKFESFRVQTVTVCMDMLDSIDSVIGTAIWQIRMIVVCSVAGIAFSTSIRV